MTTLQGIDPYAPTELDEGRYTVKAELGSGAHAHVYLCFDQDQRQRVAAKLLTLADQEPEVAMLSFEREVAALDGLSHPNIVPLLRHFIDPGTKRPTLILEHIPGGGTLHQMLLKANSTGPDRKDLSGIKWRLERLLELLGALDTAHRAGVIHRDLKPSNLLYDEDNDTFKIVDFGIARVLANYSQKSVAGDTLRRFYTEPFAAPEQLDLLAAQAPADLHAFGVLMVSLLGGCALKKSFDPRDPDQLNRLLQPLREALGEESTDLYERLASLVGRLVRQDYSERATLPEVERVLKDAVLSLTDKRAVRLDLLPSARQKLITQGGRGFGDNNSELIKDLNDGLRVLYEPQESGPVIRLYGRRIYAVARLDRDEPEQLVIFHAELPEENIHRNRQHQAKAAPFRIELGRGHGLDLLEFAHGQYLETQAEREEVRKRKDLFQVAQAMLKVQRQQLLRMEVHCTRVRQEAGHAAYGSHEYLTVRLEGVSSGGEDGGDAADHGLESTFLEGLDDKTSFDFGERRLGSFHSYDAARRLLNIRLVGQPPVLPQHLTLLAYNAASEASFKRQEKALRLFYNKQTFNPRLAQLLVYPDSNSIGDVLPRRTIQQLEPSQEMGRLVNRIMAARDLFVLQGPPGTGKTAIIAETVAQLLKERPNARILVASQANEAVNNAFDALERVRSAHGNTWRMYRDVSRHREDQDSGRGFDSVFRAWAEDTRSNVVQAYENRRQQKVWPTATGEAIFEILTDWARNLERIDDVRVDYANSVHIVGATCMRVPEALRRFTQRHFDWVIVDEAAKATSAEVLVSMVHGRKFLLVGDHRQLPPHVPDDTIDDLAEMDISSEQVKKSLFEHLYETINTGNRHMLYRQRRMHRSIAALVSEIAYRDRPLETAVEDDQLSLQLSQYAKDDRVFWLDVHQGVEKQLPNSRSFYNKEEASVIEEELERIEQEARAAGVAYTVGVIAPYGSQIQLLRERVQPGSGRWQALKIDIDTVDAFQGKQKAIIIYSTTRTSRHNWKFVADGQRLNVALSRAQRLVLIVGHYQHAHHSPNLAPVLTRVSGSNNIIRQEPT